MLFRSLSNLKKSVRSKLASGAEKVQHRAGYIAHRMRTEKPNRAQPGSFERTSSSYRGIGQGKRVEVAGSGKTEKKESEIKKVSVKDVTPKKPKAAPVGTAENPRVGQPGPGKPKPKAKTTTIKADATSGSKPPPPKYFAALPVWAEN